MSGYSNHPDKHPTQSQIKEPPEQVSRFPSRDAKLGARRKGLPTSEDQLDAYLDSLFDDKLL